MDQSNYIILFMLLSFLISVGINIYQFILILGLRSELIESKEPSMYKAADTFLTSYFD